MPYVVANTGLGLGLMYLAGMVSGLLGIGSGVLKVPAMDMAMHIPMKVSTATSNLLIGLTAAASAVVYFARGDIDPLIAGPVAIGVLLGATQGSKLLAGIRADRLRVLFVIVLVRRGRPDALEGDRLMAPSGSRHGALVPPSPHGVRAAVGRVLRARRARERGVPRCGLRSSGSSSDPAPSARSAVEQAHLAGRARFPHSLAAVGTGSGAAAVRRSSSPGCSCLILTPVAGLVTSAVAFARRRDWLFAAISATVLCGHPRVVRARLVVTS